MTKEKVKNFLRSEVFKKISLLFGLGLILLSFFVVIDPKLFLKFGYWGIFFSHLLGAGAILTIGVAQYTNPLLLAFVSALGMAFNDTVAYIVGRNSDVLVERPKKIKKIEGGIQKYGPLALFFWSFIPFPYDLIGVVAGYLHLDYVRFFIPTFTGKFLRTFLIAAGIIKIFN